MRQAGGRETERQRETETETETVAHSLMVKRSTAGIASPALMGIASQGIVATIRSGREVTHPAGECSAPRARALAAGSPDGAQVSTRRLMQVSTRQFFKFSPTGPPPPRGGAHVPRRACVCWAAHHEAARRLA
eukprot:COSAG03_NODE_1288_length_4397_cov_11.788041_3_plen_133_part_00